jgi:hypothetical protein
MSNMTQAEILTLANEIAEIDDDMTEMQVGGGQYGRRLPVGWSVARLVRYVEKGKHLQSYQGKAKDPALEFSLGFALYSKPYVAKNAKPGTEPRSVVGEVRAGIDVVTSAEYQCPAATDLFLFSWAKPTLAAWQAMFIEGTNDQGKSKNWQQEKIAGAIDFAGSPLEALLVANGQPIPKGTPQKNAVGAAPAGAQPAGAAPAGVVAPVAPATPSVAPAAPAAVPNVAAASVPATSPAVAPAPAVPSALAVAATPVAPVVAPAAPVAAAVAPAVSPAVVSAPVVPAPLAQ